MSVESVRNSRGNGSLVSRCMQGACHGGEVGLISGLYVGAVTTATYVLATAGIDFWSGRSVSIGSKDANLALFVIVAALNVGGLAGAFLGVAGELEASVHEKSGLNPDPHSVGNRCKRAGCSVFKAGMRLGILGAALTGRLGSWNKTATTIAGSWIALSMMYDRMRLRTGDFSPEFWEELDRMNALKPRSSPLAVYTLPRVDHNEAFKHLAGELAILQMAQTHRLVVRSVGSITELDQTLRGIAAEFGPIDALYFGGHGHPTRIMLGAPSLFKEVCLGLACIPLALRKKDWEKFLEEAKRPYIYGLDENHEQHFQPIAGRNIYLISCLTGMEGTVPTEEHIPEKHIAVCLARRIAQETHKRVWGAPSC